MVEVGRAMVDDRRASNDVYFLLSVKDSTHRFKIKITQIKCSQIGDFVPGERSTKALRKQLRRMHSGW